MHSLTPGRSLVSAVATLAVVASSFLLASPANAVPVADDTTAPAVTIVSPAAGAVFAPGTMNFDATIVDDNPLVSYLTIDGKSGQYSNNGSLSPSFTVDTSGLAEGVHTAKIETKDAAGNRDAGSVALVQFVIDATAPRVAITAPKAGAVVAPGTLAFKATVTDVHPKVSYLTVDSGSPQYLDSSTTTPSFTINTAGMAEGVHTAKIETKDAAGNRDAGSVASVQFVIDATAPDVVITSPLPGLLVAEGTDIPFSALVTDAHPNANYLTVDGGSPQYLASSTTTPAFTIHTAGLSEGVHTAKIETRDAAGNADAGSVATVTFEVDAGAPDVVITAPANGSFVKKGAMVHFAATINDYSPWIYYMSGDGVTGDYAYGSTLTNYVRDFSTSGWADGSTHKLKFEARDSLNQKDAGSVATVAVTIDGTGPVVKITTPVKNDVVSGTSVSVSGTATDAGSGLLDDKVVLNLRTVNPATGNCSGTVLSLDAAVDSAGHWTAAFDSSVFPAGKYCITVLAHDKVGNANLGGGTHLKTITIKDVIRPAIAITSPVVHQAVSGTVNVTGTATDVSGILNDAVVVNLRSVSSATGNCSANLTSLTAAVVNGQWTVPLDTVPFAAGNYCITVLASDTAGNNNGGGTTLKTITILDVTAPAKVILSAPSDGSILPGGVTFTVNWQSVEPGASYTLHTSTSSTVVAGALTENIGSATTHDLSYVVTGSPDDVYYWQVRATDAAGNVGPWSDVWTLEVRTAPAVAPTFVPTAQLRTFALPTAGDAPEEQLTTLALPFDDVSTTAVADDAGDAADDASASLETEPATAVSQDMSGWWWALIVFVLLLMAALYIVIARRRRRHS